MKHICRFTVYLVYILFVGYLFYYWCNLNKLMDSHLDLFLYIFYPVFVGFLLGLVGIINKFNAEKFEYDWIKALGLGLPSLLYVASLYLFWHNVRFPHIPYSFDYPLSGIILGYVLVSAIKGIPIKVPRHNGRASHSNSET